MTGILGGATLTINRDDLAGMTAEVTEHHGCYVSSDRILAMLVRMVEHANAEPAWVGSNYTRDSLYDGFRAEGVNDGQARVRAHELFGQLVTARGNALARAN